MLNEDSILTLMNQTFEIEHKLGESPVSRNLQKMKHVFEESGYSVINPLNEKYDVSRTDCEANIVGELSDNLVISKVIKPIITKKEGAHPVIVQRAIVIVEGK